jgi:hypothetical protein
MFGEGPMASQTGRGELGSSAQGSYHCPTLLLAGEGKVSVHLEKGGEYGQIHYIYTALEKVIVKPVSKCTRYFLKYLQPKKV